MKKQVLKTFTCLILILLLIQSASATTVFLTSDHIGSEDNDLDILNSVKTYIEEISGGKIEVIIDNQAPSPGEGTRAIEASADVSVTFAANCAGNFLIMSKAMPNINKQIIFVNMGDFDLDNAEFIRRAWDDNYSGDYFAGINSPGKFLNNAGINYIQPLQKFPSAGESYTSSNDEINRYIAQEIVNQINQGSSNKYYDESLLVTHSLHPSKMAKSSRELMESGETKFENNYNSYSAPQLLYLTSSYLNGNGLKEPSNYAYPDSPLESSIFTKDSYSIYDYMKMGGMTKKYMDENGKAPNYIKYEGAYISYYDLVYNFAKITENHTASEHMDFATSYHFEKVNHSILIDALPIVVIALILLVLYGLIRRFKNRRRRRRY
ncbi:MAG: adhesin [Methanosphaera stadtmanae]|nr:adhesin [Methanosphaera stadtmanae]